MLLTFSKTLRFRITHWRRSLPALLFLLVFLVRVAADGDDADGGTGRVGDDDGLSGEVLLVLVVAGGARGRL